MVDDGRRPGALAGARQPRPGVEPLEDLAHRQALLHEPVVEHADEGRLGLVDDQVPRHAVALGHVAVAVGRAPADEVALARLLQLATPEPLAQQRPLVLGDGALDLQQELVAGGVGERVVEEDDLAALAAELLQQQHLVGVLAGEAVRAEHGDDVDGRVLDRVAQAVEPRAVQAGAAVALIGEDVLGQQLMAVGLGPLPQRGQLAGDGLLAPLALRRDPGVDRGAHRVPPR
ncbi:MAG: hypothetical protein AVDCRST_MAG27-2839 [uncultured Craurococcus sp.]|uniref:Uncharacterized protein n=1 Tax=uncultured Craurococcus sp. TaxID=1135998 RepID=A0A6J4J2E9_9PROT|nr:MAG: hypothetical protein AVDCRST_MAG27-2839 [uncultured Craurococcus sp.]